jgi:hypothetical protein
LIMGAGGTSITRMVTPAEQAMGLVGGRVIESYVNKYALWGSNVVRVNLHPNIPPGTILFTTREIPYKLANIRNILQIKNRRDYFQIEWPVVQRQYEYGVYLDSVLQCYFPPAFGIITNIAPT